MSKISLYLPDELAAAVKDAQLPVSPICQKALREAVQKIARMRKAIDALRDPQSSPQLIMQIGWQLESANAHLRDSLQHASQASNARIATKHLLLGMLEEGNNVAVGILRALDIDIDDLRGATEKLKVSEELALRRTRRAENGEPEAVSQSAIPYFMFTMPSRRAIAAALLAAIDLGHDYVGCGHLLIGLADETVSGNATQLLNDFGVNTAVASRAVRGAYAGFAYAQEMNDPLEREGKDFGELERRISELETRLDAMIVD